MHWQLPVHLKMGFAVKQSGVLEQHLHLAIEIFPDNAAAYIV